jgi:hypothetical protein
MHKCCWEPDSSFRYFQGEKMLRRVFLRIRRRGNKTKQKAVITTSPEFMATVRSKRDTDTCVLFKHSRVKTTQMSKRKVTDETSEEDEAKEMCDNVASENEECSFVSVKNCYEQSKQLGEWIQLQGNGKVWYHKHCVGVRGWK